MFITSTTCDESNDDATMIAAPNVTPVHAKPKIAAFIKRITSFTVENPRRGIPMKIQHAAWRMPWTMDRNN
jgi:hypothetical protein